jgi:tetratricopeptide (TPR) repeat protein
MAWMLYQSGEWTKAIKYTKEWLADQPFSSRPAIHASYIAMVALQDYEESAAIALQGLRANPQEFLLINNRAAALALMDKPDAARKLFATARTDKLDKTGMVVWHATSGLIAFRSSHVDAGRRLYEQAIKQAEAMKSDRLVVMATLFYSMEESKHDIGRAKALIASTLKRRRLVSERGVDVLADRAMSAVTQLT